MARYTGPKHKVARKLGVNVLEKASASLDRRLNVTPGAMNKRGGRRKVSEYGLQLKEKQKLKAIYGLLEKQFRNYVTAAEKKKINTADALIQLLETRLDNMVYRLGLVNSRPMARQLVSHRHVFVNGARVNIPSYHVKPGDVITLSPKFAGKENIKIYADEHKEGLLPFVTRENMAGKLERLPQVSEVPNPIDYQLVIEFYSR